MKYWGIAAVCVVLFVVLMWLAMYGGGTPAERLPPVPTYTEVADMRAVRPLVIATLLALAASAHAETTSPIHWKFSKAALAFPLDSTSITLLQSSRDTSQTFKSSDYSVGGDYAAVDTSVTGPAGTPRVGLTLTIEVTGAMTSIDSLYLGWQVSEDGSRWYRGLNPLASTANSALVSATGTQTFIFLIPSNPHDVNSWINHGFFRWDLAGDGNAAATGFTTRGSMTYRPNR